MINTKDKTKPHPECKPRRDHGKAEHLHCLGTSCVYDLIPQGEKKQASKVFRMLAVGAENAVTAADLAAKLGIPPRALTQRIRVERLAGFPIASCSKGYFIPRDRTEAAAIARKLHSRAAAIHETANAIERVAAINPEQMEVF